VGGLKIVNGVIVSEFTHKRGRGGAGRCRAGWEGEIRVQGNRALADVGGY